MPNKKQSRDELNKSLQVFYAFVRQKMEANSKFFSLQAICGSIDWYLKQPPHNKPWSIISDSKFAKPNQTLNAVCKNMMKEGKVSPVVHKNPITNVQMQELFTSLYRIPLKRKKESSRDKLNEQKKLRLI